MVEVSKKRNVAIVAHHGAGKTSLVEAILYSLGKLDRMGKTEDGNTFSDFTDEERERKVSIHSSLIHIEYNKHSINLLDLPGYADFIGEVKASLRACGCALFAINATSPVEVETEKAWGYADEFDLARIAVVNHLDKERADFGAAVNALQEHFGKRCVPIQVPIGAEANFRGVVDLVSMKALTFDSKGNSKVSSEIPAECEEMIASYREMMMDCAAEVDEAVMEKYLSGEELTREEMLSGLKKAVSAKTCIPILCSSATHSIGIQPILDAIVDFLPSPERHGEMVGHRPGSEEKVVLKVADNSDLSALVFKTRIDPHAGRLSFVRIWTGSLKPDTPILNATTGKIVKAHNILQLSGKEQKTIPEATAGDIICLAKIEEININDSLCAPGDPIVIPPTEFPPPTIQMAVRSQGGSDDEKLAVHLHKIEAEDPTFHIRRDPETGETVISGMGELHLDTVIYHLRHYAKIEVEMSVPKVAYRESITSKAEGSHRHKKQSGGRGQFGEVHLRLAPKATGEGFEFVNAVVGGVVPTKFIPAVEKGVREALDRGIVAGYPVVDVQVTLFDGKDHPVDSSEAAFKMAGSVCFRKVAKEARPIILEPIVTVEVVVPDEYLGDTMSDISTKRGKVLGMDARDGHQVITAHVPLSEMFRYSIDLRSITRGRGSFTMKVDHYEPVPQEIAQKIIDSATLEDEDEG
jgi:elongation factor G